MTSKGFSLLELMIAVALLVIGVLSATFMFSRGMFATSDVEATEQAIALAQERMESIRGTPFSSISIGTTTESTPLPDYSRQVAVSLAKDVPPTGDSAGDLKQVVITVSWNTSGGQLSTSVTSYVANVANN